MRKSLIFFVTCVLVSMDAVASDCVILLHGLARSESSMSKMSSALEEAGYYAVNMGYPSRESEIALLSEDTIPKALERCPEGVPVSFVTHSMGGIIVRQYLSEYEIPNLKHVVMLGPPNRGSEVVENLKNVPGFKAINGPAGLQLGTEKSSVPNSLGPATFSLGVIAGSRSINPILSTMLPNPDDGKVSVENTKLEGMKDHIVMPVTHPFMMKNNEVIEQVLHFLEFGEFSHSNPEQSREPLINSRERFG
ncbi:alpha/beta hydrolase [Microbulbifer thermotolerans]|uniref:esterase/lipase family protein n=1 Tax=Microbulbifer thermotolerans TaxID=252514 RepID=UPI0026716978|nr:alpha/beta hydrolase [Microbulbifer thermotolerans]WKT59333.1 alpha/beta hydrolase [Microbulbifer thermotolerans]